MQVINDEGTADLVAQLSVPIVCQFFLTPTHLLALDIYNRPGASVTNRVW